MEQSNLYGSFNHTGQTWADGVLTAAVRASSSDIHMSAMLQVGGVCGVGWVDVLGFRPGSAPTSAYTAPLVSPPPSPMQNGCAGLVVGGWGPGLGLPG